jgi:hypothetical protein
VAGIAIRCFQRELNLAHKPPFYAAPGSLIQDPGLGIGDCFKLLKVAPQ